jgi:hypothetical protein
MKTCTSFCSSSLTHLVVLWLQYVSGVWKQVLAAQRPISKKDDIPATIIRGRKWPRAAQPVVSVLFKESAQWPFCVAVGTSGPSQFISPIFSSVWKHVLNSGVLSSQPSIPFLKRTTSQQPLSVVVSGPYFLITSFSSCWLTCQIVLHFSSFSVLTMYQVS